jgi:hypothetical protein
MLFLLVAAAKIFPVKAVTYINWAIWLVSSLALFLFSNLHQQLNHPIVKVIFCKLIWLKHSTVLRNIWAETIGIKGSCIFTPVVFPYLAVVHRPCKYLDIYGLKHQPNDHIHLFKILSHFVEDNHVLMALRLSTLRHSA